MSAAIGRCSSPVVQELGTSEVERQFFVLISRVLPESAKEFEATPGAYDERIIAIFKKVHPAACKEIWQAQIPPSYQQALITAHLLYDKEQGDQEPIMPDSNNYTRLVRLGQLKRAVDYAKRSQEPETVFNSICRELQELGEFDRAWEIWKENPDFYWSPSLLREFAVHYYGTDKQEELMRAAAEKISMSDVHDRLAERFVQEGKLDLAVFHFKEARLCPKKEARLCPKKEEASFFAQIMREGSERDSMCSAFSALMQNLEGADSLDLVEFMMTLPGPAFHLLDEVVQLADKEQALCFVRTVLAANQEVENPGDLSSFWRSLAKRYTPEEIMTLAQGDVAFDRFICPALVCAYVTAGRIEEAETLAIEKAAASPVCAQARLTLLEELVEVGTLLRVEYAYKWITDPDDKGEANCALARAYIKHGKYQKAWECIKDMPISGTSKAIMQHYVYSDQVEAFLKMIEELPPGENTKTFARALRLWVIEELASQGKVDRAFELAKEVRPGPYHIKQVAIGYLESGMRQKAIDAIFSMENPYSIARTLFALRKQLAQGEANDS